MIDQDSKTSFYVCIDFLVGIIPLTFVVVHLLSGFRYHNQLKNDINKLLQNVKNYENKNSLGSFFIEP
jgi:hypothetical protein